MRQYVLQRRLSHADVDFLGEIKVSALLGLLEQAAVEASAAAGFDPAWYAAAGRVWFVRRTQLVRFVPVGGRDTLEVETAVADFRRARSLRRYVVRRAGAVVAEATTDWVYCGVASGRPMRVPDEMQRAFGDGERAPTLPRPAPLPDDAPGAPVTMDLTVRPSHLDHVMHVNNAVYGDYLEDAAFRLFEMHHWPLSRMLDQGGALRVRAIDVEYLSDARAGDVLTVQSWLAEGYAVAGELPQATALVQNMVRGNGVTVLRARSEWIWRRRPGVLGAVPEG
jgi:acyl-CoA thioester hydrolase